MLTLPGRSLRQIGPLTSSRLHAIALITLLSVTLSACVDGGRASGPLDPAFLGNPDPVAADGADVVDPSDVAPTEVTDAESPTDATPPLDGVTDVAAGDVDPDVVPPVDGEGVGPGDVLEEVEEICAPGMPGCPGTCTLDDDCIELDDGNLCNGGWVCSAGNICVEGGTPVTCDGSDDTECLTSTCDPVSGACALRPLADGRGCDDGDNCTMSDHCSAGACTGGPRLHCDDGNPCTKDQCISGGCSFPAVSGVVACDDANPCTADDTCNAGICKGSTSTCECDVDDDCAEFEDGNACNGVVQCVNGKCNTPFASIVGATCPPAPFGGCGVSRCDPGTGQCEVFDVPNGAGCDDGDLCTFNDQCAAGSCAGNAVNCDDGCLDGACDAATGACTHVPAADGGACGDGSTCLAGATCSSGVCAPDASACECVATADCAAFEDGDACNGTLTCLGGRCVLDAATIVSCVVDQPRCRTASCDPATGVCTVEDATDNSSCDDDDPCTEGDFCNAGSCVGTPTECSGGTDCLVASCHPFAGCEQNPVAGACDDVDPCTASSACTVGNCIATAALDCVSSGVCFDSACDASAGGCVDIPNTADCEDGDDCTLGDVCAAGVCAGEPLVCDDGNLCTTDACEGGVCATDAIEGALCDDGNSCTLSDTCVDGICAGNGIPGCGNCDNDGDCLEQQDEDACNGTLRCDSGFCEVDPDSFVSCADVEAGPCQVAACDSSTGACAVTDRADGLPCASEDPCMADGFCAAGTCVGQPTSCDDGNPCTGDSCDAEQGCVHGPIGGPCDDGNPCTSGTACTAGTCLGGTNTCECVSNGQCNAQNDDDLCNGTLKCDGGLCVVNPTTVVLCPASTNPCAENVCNGATGQCSEAPLEDGIACSDGDPCSVGDTCGAGSCVAGPPVDCDDGNSCSEDLCDPATGGCAYQVTSASCDDDNPCTLTDACAGGECIGQPNVCSCFEDAGCDTKDQLADKCLGTPVCGPFGCELLPDSAPECGQPGDSPCDFTACDPATGDCIDVELPDGAGCESEDKCVVGSLCDAEGSCVGGDPLACDDGNPCTDDSCDPAVGCVFTPVADDSGCDDADFCTIGESCQAGACTGGFNQCGCTSDIQCQQYQPDDKCDGQYTCEQTPTGKKCVLGEPVICLPTGKEPCLTNACSPSTGQCQQGAAADGTACEDDDPCTVGDECVSFLQQCLGTVKSCDDGDVCTADSCDAFTGECTSDAAGADGLSCTVEDPCIKGAACDSGECIGEDFCNCTTDAKCGFLDDGDVCTGVFTCVEGRCDFDEASVVICIDSNPFDCIDQECSPAQGVCSAVPREAGSECDDAFGLCTSNDTCQLGGACVGDVVVECSDPTPDDCSDFTCVPELGACGEIRRDDTLTCDDDNACTNNDQCVLGACQGTLAPCNDSSPCTEDICSASLGCLHVELYGPCDDGDPCTEGSFCQDGVCEPGDDICSCSEEADCQFLDDGDVCTGAWDCAGNNCLIFPGTNVECDVEVGEGQDEQCLDVSCDAETGECSTFAVPDDTGCDDGDVCTTTDRCVAGGCLGTVNDCDDGNDCTTDTCNPVGLCAHAVLGNATPCEDGDSCNGADACTGGVCVSGTEQLCPCADTSECPTLEVGALCGAAHACVGGHCVLNPVTLPACPIDPTGCRVWTCDGDTGDCVESNLPTGTACNDGDGCTVDDQCSFGVCEGSPRDCADTEPCTDDVCDPVVGCVHNEFSGPCDDGDPCSKDEACLNGNCIGSPDDCEDGEACTKDSCLVGLGCRHLPEPPSKACNDGNPCTDDDRCNGSGGCSGSDLICICAEDFHCDDSNGGDQCVGQYSCAFGFCILDKDTIPECAESTDCLAVSCDPDTGSCVEEIINDGGACSDGSLCTEGDTCVAGSCVGTPVICPDAEPLNPCIEPVCIPTDGCSNGQVTASSCNDSSLCTVDDHCVEGACVGAPLAKPGDSFGALELDDSWELTSTGQQAAWQLSAANVVSPPFALQLVNAGTADLSDSGGAYTAGAAWTVDVPFGPLGTTVDFKLLADYETSGCEHQSFTVSVDDVNLGFLLRDSGTSYLPAQPCNATQGWKDGRLFLPAQASGSTVTIEFNLDMATTDATGGSGVFIDDVTLEWSCSN